MWTNWFVFWRLDQELETRTWLCPTKYLSLEEQVAIFLHIAHTGQGNIEMPEHFQWSGVLWLRNNIGGRSYSVRCRRYVGCVQRSGVNGMKTEGWRNMSEVGGRSEVGRSRVGTTSDATEEDLASALGAAPSLQWSGVFGFLRAERIEQEKSGGDDIKNLGWLQVSL